MDDMDYSYGERYPLLGERRYRIIFFFFETNSCLQATTCKKFSVSYLQIFKKNLCCFKPEPCKDHLRCFWISMCYRRWVWSHIHNFVSDFCSFLIILEVCFRAFESVIHLMKGYIGIGIFILPFAFIYAGLVGGIVGVLFCMFISIHCANILSAASQKIIVIK